MSSKNTTEIIKNGQLLLDRLAVCDLCPQNCGVDRTAGQTGQCGVTDQLIVASCNLHFGEEPPISGSRGSGTIFFSGCSLRCLYCQNYPISQEKVGSIITIDELTDKMIELQDRRAHNINLVTPDHYFGHILIAIGKAKERGLILPIVCNSSGYQKTETLKLLEGIIDIYLVDMRYSDNEIACNCSGAGRYKEANQAALIEMHRQVGDLVVRPEGIAKKGILVRHLVLPEGKSGSDEIFRFLADKISPQTYVSLMSQYFPAYLAVDHRQLGRPITRSEFDKAVEMFYNAGLSNGFIQEMK